MADYTVSVDVDATGLDDLLELTKTSQKIVLKCDTKSINDVIKKFENLDPEIKARVAINTKDFQVNLAKASESLKTKGTIFDKNGIVFDDLIDVGLSETKEKINSELKEILSDIKNAIEGFSESGKGSFDFLKEQLPGLTTSLSTVADKISELHKAFVGIGEDGNVFNPMINNLNQLKEAISGINLNLNLTTGNKNPIAQTSALTDLKRNQIDILQKYSNAILNSVSVGNVTDVFKGQGQALAKYMEASSLVDPSNVSQTLRAYQDMIKILKEVSNVKGIDLSSIIGEFEPQVESANEELRKMISGEEDAAKAAQRIMDVFGGSKTEMNFENFNTEGIVKQLDFVIEKLETISNLIKGSLDFDFKKAGFDTVTNENNDFVTLYGTLESITQAVREKNQAFEDEGHIVTGVTNMEQNDLGYLLQAVVSVTDAVRELGNALRELDAVNLKSLSDIANSGADLKELGKAAEGAKRKKKDKKEKDGTPDGTPIATFEVLNDELENLQSTKEYKELEERIGHISKVTKHGNANNGKWDKSYVVQGEHGSAIIGEDKYGLSMSVKMLDDNDKLLSRFNKQVQQYKETNDKLELDRTKFNHHEEFQNIFGNDKYYADSVSIRKDEENLIEINKNLALSFNEIKKAHEAGLLPLEDYNNAYEEFNKIGESSHTENFSKELNSLEGYLKHKVDVKSLSQDIQKYETQVNEIIALEKELDKAKKSGNATDDLELVLNKKKKSTEDLYNRLINVQKLNTLDSKEDEFARIVRAKAKYDNRNVNKVNETQAKHTNTIADDTKTYNKNVADYYTLKNRTIGKSTSVLEKERLLELEKEILSYEQKYTQITQKEQNKNTNNNVLLGYDRIQRLNDLKANGIDGQFSLYPSLRLNENAYKSIIKDNNYFSDIKSGKFIKIEDAITDYVTNLLSKKGLSEENIVNQLKGIQSAQGGSFKQNGQDSGWTHFATYNENGQKDQMQKIDGMTYKVYAAFEDILDLNRDTISSIMQELSNADFKGRLKTTSGSTSFGDKTNALAMTDQLVIHGATKADQEIAYNVLKKFQGANLSYLGGGFDSKDGSFSQMLSSGDIEKYVSLQEVKIANEEKFESIIKDEFKQNQEINDALQRKKALQDEYIDNAEKKQTKDNSTKKQSSKQEVDEIDKLVSEYSSAIEKYYQLQNKSIKNPLGEVDSTEQAKYLQIMQESQAKIDALKGTQLENDQRILDVLKQRNDYEADYQSLLAKEAKKPEDKFDAQKKNLENKYSSKILGIDRENISSGLSDALDKYETKLEELRNKPFVDEETNEKVIAKIKADLDDLYKGVQAEVKKSSDANLKRQEAFIAKAYEYANKNSSDKEGAARAKEMADYASSTRLATEELEAMELELLKIDSAAEKAGKSGISFGDRIKNKFKDVAVYFASFVSIQEAIRVAKEGFNIVREIDDAMTELRKVSEASDQRISLNFDISTKSAKELNSTISDTIKATADWQRNGYNISESEELARVSLLYKNVGDGIDIDTANESLISTLRGFEMEASQAIDIIDAFNEVANNMPIDSAGIGNALQRSAASFHTANTDLNESIALITATNSVLMDPEKVGNMWKTVSARIRGADTELKELGEDTDEYVESTSKLRGLIKGMTGFDILESDEKTFKSIYDIVLGIGDAWKGLNDLDRAALLEALAGKVQSNALAAALNNIDMIRESYEIAQNSAGSAMEEQARYAESISARIATLQASLQELATNLINSDTVKVAISGLTGVVEILTKITSFIGPIGTLGTVIASIFAFKNFKNIGIMIIIIAYCGCESTGK